MSTRQRTEDGAAGPADPPADSGGPEAGGGAPGDAGAGDAGAAAETGAETAAETGAETAAETGADGSGGPGAAAEGGAEGADAAFLAEDGPPLDTAAVARLDGGGGAPAPGDEAAELKDRLLRSLAELENLRNRARREREDALRYGGIEIAREMVAVADNLRRALESAPADAADALAGFVEGVVLTERGLHDALERRGVRRIDAQGRRFDPNLHEAMVEIPSPDADPGTVVEVIETGYMFHERLLRPARVAVAKAPPGD